MRLCCCTLLVLLLLVPNGCAPLGSVIPFGASGPGTLASAVTIARDEWGVPHVLGETDAAALFGIGYAQAEDAFWRLEEDYLHALGRASHWYGERYLASDLLQAAFEIERLSREEYLREPAERRSLWDAFAAGINFYIATSGVRPRLLTNFEPWMPFALARAIPAGTTIDGVQLGVTTRTADGIQLVGQPVDTIAGDTSHHYDRSRTAEYGRGELDAWPQAGSVWAVSRSRSESGMPLLLHQHAGRFFGSGTTWEMMVDSETGWHVRGHARLGMPMPAGGHTDRTAWGHTASFADVADLYEIRFDRGEAGARYVFDGEWRTAVEWEDTLLVNSPTGVVGRVFRFRRTHHGPIVLARDGVALAAGIARMDEGGSLQQLHAQGKSKTIEEFRAALDQRALHGNTIYADVDGNIFYLHGNAQPVRRDGVDAGVPLDGTTSATAWLGYRPINDLPQMLNPPGGWIVGGGERFEVGGEESAAGAVVTLPRRAAASAAARIVAGDSSWAFDDWSAAAFDTYVHDAADLIPELIAEWEQVGGMDAARARRLDDALEELRSWDYKADAGSEAATLFILWREQLRTGVYGGEHVRFQAMEHVVARLERDHGSAMVALGAVNRLQRRPPDETFSDDDASLPMQGAPGWAESVFSFDAVDVPESRMRYGIAGTRWIAAVELGPDVRFRSVVPFGQSGDPASPHWFDQAPLYAGGTLKRGRFGREDITGSATRIYRPGDAPVRELP